LIDFPQDLIEKLRTTERVVALTGAGASAESGVATFRDAQTGFWAEYRPEDLATPEAFHQNPQRVWQWYQWRRSRIGAVEPNRGHYALVEMEKQLLARSANFLLITQNVDGLHMKAGSQHILEIHGNIQRTKCAACLTPIVNWEEGSLSPPHCPKCDGLLRPDVVWFGESLPRNALNHAVEKSKDCEIFFSIGTSALVQPAASLPVLALHAGALVVEINLNPTPISQQVTYSFRGRSGDILPEIVRAAWE
jgi:NAD-dependent deacetylase